MTRITFITSLLLFSFTCYSQDDTDNDSIVSLFFKSVDELLPQSEVIDNETFDLRFLIRVLPDNGWYLKFNKDSTYEYVHWSGFGDPEGTILEKGKYEISKNKVKLYPPQKKSGLGSIDFYLVTSPTDEIDNNITIDCVESESKIYCLCRWN